MQDNFFEYAVDVKPQGKLRRRRLLLIALYVLFSLLYFFGAATIGIPHIIAILPLLLWILVYYTWLYVSVSYEYVIAVGEITFTAIYGSRKRKELLRIPVRKADAIFYEDDGTIYDQVYDFRSERNALDSYAIAFRDEEGHRILVWFEATRKALKILQLYNPSAVKMGKTLRY